MKKILIVGTGPILAETMEKLKTIRDNIQISSVDNLHGIDTQNYDVIVDEKNRPLNEPEIFEITARPVINEPFYPKAKHLPKGHERPYKYHP